MPNMDEWRASLTEYRIAWITALCGIALILIASAWPELFMIRQSEPPAKPAAERPVAAKPVPEAPSEPSAEEKATLEKVIEESAPLAAETPKTKPEAKPEVSPPARKAEPKPATPAVGYYVQVGAFKDISGAKEVADKLGRHGWPALVVPKNGLYAVWAGPRQSRVGIEKLQQEILRGLKIKGFIVQKKPA